MNVKVLLWNLLVVVVIRLGPDVSRRHRLVGGEGLSDDTVTAFDLETSKVHIQIGEVEGKVGHIVVGEGVDKVVEGDDTLVSGLLDEKVSVLSYTSTSDTTPHLVK